MKRAGPVVLMIVAGFVAWLLLSTRPPATQASVVVDAGAVAAAVAPPPAVNELPRPQVRDAGADAAIVAAPPSVRAAFEAQQQAQAPHGPVDKRGGVPSARASAEMEMISYAFETLNDDIDDCLAEWGKTSDVAPQEVMLGFEIDANGLQRSWVDSQSDAGVPFGVRTCFANAVYGLDWSHIVEQPAKITNRFNLGDAGR